MVQVIRSGELGGRVEMVRGAFVAVDHNRAHHRVSRRDWKEEKEGEQEIAISKLLTPPRSGLTSLVRWRHSM